MKACPSADIELMGQNKSHKQPFTAERRREDVRKAINIAI
jgi:hypothetical protein